MAVHMIRVWASTAGMTEQEIQDAVADWVDKNSEWVEDPADHQITISNAEVDRSGTDFYHGSFRFELTDSKDNLLQKCADKLKNKIDWFRLVYHTCDHDETDRDGCTWDERWNWEDSGVTVPSDVEDLIPVPDTVTNA